jgi:glutathione S-transferase
MHVFKNMHLCETLLFSHSFDNYIPVEWRPFLLEKDPEVKEKKKVSLSALVQIGLQRIEGFVKSNGGSHVAGGEISWADLALAHYLDTFERTVDVDLLKSYPALQKLKDSVFQIPQIKKWVEKRPPFVLA